MTLFDVIPRTFAWAKKSKSKMASLIRANPSMISGHRVDIDDKTNQTAERSIHSISANACVISYWRWVYVLTVKRARNAFLPECNRTRARDIPHRKSMTVSRHHNKYQRKLPNNPVYRKRYFIDFIKSFSNRMTLIN